MNNYETKTKSATSDKKLTVEVLAELLSQEQIEVLATMEIRRQFAELFRNISGTQLDKYTPTEGDQALWSKALEEGKFIFDIAAHMKSKGIRIDSTDSALNKLAKDVASGKLSREDLLKRLGIEI